MSEWLRVLIRNPMGLDCAGSNTVCSVSILSRRRNVKYIMECFKAKIDDFSGRVVKVMDSIYNQYCV